MVAFTTDRIAEKNSQLWIAHSQSHGWVVLDRSLPVNTCTDMPEEFLFTRCRDGKQYEQGDQPWNYREAGRYLDSLPINEALIKCQELEAFQQEFCNSYLNAA